MLERMGDAARPAVPALLDALEPRLGDMIGQALRAIDPAGARERLLGVIRDRGAAPAARAGAARAIAWCGGSPDVLEALIRVRLDPEAIVREAAEHALFFLPRLKEEALGSESGKVRKRAAEALEEIEKASKKGP